MSETITHAEHSRSIKLEPVLSWVEANISKHYHLGTVGNWWLSWSLSLAEVLVEAQTQRGITFGDRVSPIALAVAQGLRRFQRPGQSGGH